MHTTRLADLEARLAVLERRLRGVESARQDATPADETGETTRRMDEFNYLSEQIGAVQSLCLNEIERLRERMVALEAAQQNAPAAEAPDAATETDRERNGRLLWEHHRRFTGNCLAWMSLGEEERDQLCDEAEGFLSAVRSTPNYVRLWTLALDTARRAHEAYNTPLEEFAHEVMAWINEQEER